MHSIFSSRPGSFPKRARYHLRNTTLNTRSSKKRPTAHSPRNPGVCYMRELPKRWRAGSPRGQKWNRSSWRITMNRPDWPVRPWSIGNLQLAEMRNDQPISKRSIILIGRWVCSRICRKARNVMPWSWTSSLHAESPWCP